MALVELESVVVEVQAPMPAILLGPIDLHVEAGESLAVVGPSGSGKSTLVSVLGGMLPPTSGVHRFADEVLPTSPGRLARFRADEVGFVFQAAHLIEDRTAIENVELALSVPSHRDRSASDAGDALASVGIAHLAHRPARVLSGGERQRVAVARALVGNPSLLIADEPTGSLDRRNGSVILDLLFDLPRRGTALVLVTHDREAADRADRHARLVDGTLR